MTYPQACILYYKWLAIPGNDFIPFIPWYHEQKIEIEPDERTKRLIEITGYTGHTIDTEIINWVLQQIRDAVYRLDLIIKRIKESIAFTIDDIYHFFRTIFATIGNIVGTIANTITSIVSGILQTIKSVAEWIVTTVSMIVDTIKQFIKDVWDWIKNLYETVKDFVVAAFKKGLEGLGIALETIKKWIQTVATSIWEGIKAVGGAIKWAFDKTIGWAWNKLKDVYESIKNAFLTARDWIVGVYETIGKVVSNIIAGIKEGFKVGLDSMILFLQELWEKIIALLDSLFDLSVDALSEVFVQIFYAQKEAFKKLTLEAETV